MTSATMLPTTLGSTSSLPQPSPSLPIPIPRLTIQTPNRVYSQVDSLSSPSDKGKGRERAMEQIFREIVQKYHLHMEVLCEDWTFKFTNPQTGVTASVFGYNFDINRGGAQKICDDKVATSAVLLKANVPAIEHKLFLRDCNVRYVDVAGSMEQIYKYTKQFQYNVVCKPVSGSGGKNVSHVENKRELNEAVRNLFNQSHSICISPYKKFKHEYRIIMFEEPQLVFRKTRPSLVGDGKSTVLQLFLGWAQTNTASVKKMDLSKLPLERVLAEGEILELGWQHNLCNGASAQLLPLKNRKIESIQQNISNTTSDSKQGDFKDQELLGRLIEIAKKAVTALGIRFCSVDIVELSDENLQPGERLQVLEVNAGVLMENFIKQHGSKGYKKAKSIYEKVICEMLKIPVEEISFAASALLKLSSSPDDSSSDGIDSPSPSQGSTTSSPRDEVDPCFLLNETHRDDVDPRAPLTASTPTTPSSSAPSSLITVPQKRMQEQLEQRSTTPTLWELGSKKATDQT